VTVRVAILISGGGSNMVALVESMTGGHPRGPVRRAVQQPRGGGLERARAGRAAGRWITAPSASDRAAFEAALAEALRPHSADILCLAGFMRVLTGGFVDRWRGGC
jgi:phosphoribosylglycinamide formyltransferase-1